MSNYKNNKKAIPRNSNRSIKLFQWLLFTILLVVVVLISIAECKTDNGLWWGIATLYCVNGSILFWSVKTIVEASRGDYANKDKIFRVYYEWIHFPVEIIFALVGHVVLCKFHVTWVLLLNLLTGTWPIVGAYCLEEFIFGYSDVPKKQS